MTRQSISLTAEEFIMELVNSALIKRITILICYMIVLIG